MSRIVKIGFWSLCSFWMCGLADMTGQILFILAANAANPIDAAMHDMV